MNKYERLFQEIVDATKAGKLTWKQLSKRANSDVIFNQNLVFRQFSSQLVRGDFEFTVLFVEKKHQDVDSDFAYERYLPEILILDGGELIASITDSVIDRGEMIKLAELVESKSDKSKKLFEPEISRLFDKLETEVADAKRRHNELFKPQ